MKDIHQFLVYMAAAMVVYFIVLTFTVRKRSPRPYLTLILLTLIVTAGGMIFARITYGKEMPWWIFYGVPAFLTFLLPVAILRLTWKELLTFFPLAFLMGPVIHILFSFFLDWHDFMPLFYIPWWHNAIG